MQSFLIPTCLMMALKDLRLSRAVRASPATEKENIRKKPMMPANIANAINNIGHNLPSSSALQGSVNTFSNSKITKVK